jgi:hypothetical protein
MSSKLAARPVRDEPAEVISHYPGWLLQVQRHEYSEFVVPSNPATLSVAIANPTSLQFK